MAIDNLVHKKEGESSLATWIKRRIKRNQNCLSNTEGPTGSGKSYADIGIALEIDPEFDVEKQIVFKFSDFMKLLNNEEFKKKKYKQIIFEEFQVSASNRNWQNLMNKSINYIFSTFRHQNIIVYINAPYRDFLDSQTMKMVHLVLQTKGIDRKKKEAILKPLLLQINMRKGDIYYKFLRVAKGGNVMPLKRIRVGLATPELIKQYEEKKTEFTTQLNEDLTNELEEREAKKHKGLTDKQKDVLKDLLDNKKIDQIAKERNITFQSVYDHIRFIKKKGVKIKPVKEGQEIVRYDISGYDNLL